MNEQDLARARRWMQFYNEEGGLKVILESLSTAYVDRMKQVEPWETNKLTALSIASKVVMAVEDEMRTIFAAGQIADSHKDHVRKVEKLSAAKRRWLDRSPG
jgi:hypothetical protein